MNAIAIAQSILDFWFLPADTAGYGLPRSVWFTKDPNFDEQIRTQFADRVELALAGALTEWEMSPDTALALILLLDQFTRNIYRNTPRAFAGDSQALMLAQKMVEAGMDRTLLSVQRAFVYLPFEHAEDSAMQARSVALFKRLQQETGAHMMDFDYALQHQKIITRFQRFPHRNAILGRISTPEEQTFLAQPNSGF